MIICVCANRRLRARIARRLDGYGALLTFPDLESARAVLLGPPPADSTNPPAPRPGAGSGPSPLDVDGPSHIGQLSPLVVDHARQQICWSGQALPLTRLEREVLAALAQPPLRVWTYAQLYEQVWDTGYLNNPSAVRSTVKRLRGKLRDAQLPVTVESVRGIGFSLVAQPAAKARPVDHARAAVARAGMTSNRYLDEAPAVSSTPALPFSYRTSNSAPAPPSGAGTRTRVRCPSTGA